VRQKASILIIALWVVSILSIFAVALAHRMSGYIRIAGYHTDSLKAHNLAKAGIRRLALEQKDIIKKTSVGEGSIKGVLTDEKAKVNINKTDLKTLKTVFESFNLSQAQALETAAAIITWRDEHNQFDCLEELLLVGTQEEGALIEEGLLPELSKRLTVYGDGKININTADEDILSAIIGETLPNLAEKIVAYRLGIDGETGTRDDRLFVKGKEVVLEDSQGPVETKNLDADYIEDVYLGVTPVEWQRLKELSGGGEAALGVKSDVKRVEVKARVDSATSQIEAVLEFEDDRNYKVVAWREQ